MHIRRGIRTDRLESTSEREIIIHCPRTVFRKLIYGSSISSVNGAYSACIVAIGCAACARRRVEAGHWNPKLKIHAQLECNIEAENTPESDDDSKGRYSQPQASARTLLWPP